MEHEKTEIGYGVDFWTQYIDAHITDDLTTTRLADTFHYSPTHFRRVFREYYKMSVSDYIRKRRLQMAADDIAKGMKNKDAAGKYGFSTYAGFSRAFQKEFGATPQAYRNSSFEVVDLEKYYAEYRENLVVQYIEIKDIRMIGHSILEGNVRDPDIPTQVSYWIGRDFPCMENMRFSCNVQRREDKIALWYQIPGCEDIKYILGPVVEDFDKDIPPEMIRFTIKGGRYAVFETEKQSDREDFAETIRKYTRCVFYGWIKEFRDRVDLDRITFERFLDDKVFFYVPVKY